MAEKIRSLLVVDNNDRARGSNSSLFRGSEGWQCLEGETFHLNEDVILEEQRVTRPYFHFRAADPDSVVNEPPIGLDHYERVEDIISKTGDHENLSFSRLNHDYRDWVKNVFSSLGSSLAYITMTNEIAGDPIDVLVLNSENIADVVVGAAMNRHLIDFGRQPVPILLLVNDGIIGNVDWDLRLKSMETFTSFGTDPCRPSNTGLSSLVINLLGEFDAKMKVGEGAWDFIRGLSGITAVGGAAMIAEVMPYISGIIFANPQQLTAFSQNIDFPDEIPSKVLDKKDLSQRDFKTAIVDMTEKARNMGIRVMDPGQIDIVVSHARFTRLSPKAVKAKLVRITNGHGKSEDRRHVIDLVYNDLAGTGTIQEIKCAERAIKKDRIEVKK